MASADVRFRCLVGGLAWNTQDIALRQAFSTYGDVLEAVITKDRDTGRSRGFGFVIFGSEQEMKDAIEGMNGQTLDGRSITVSEAQSLGSGDGGSYDRSRGGGGDGDGGGGGYGGGYGGGRREGGGGGGWN